MGCGVGVDVTDEVAGAGAGAAAIETGDNGLADRVSDGGVVEAEPAADPAQVPVQVLGSAPASADPDIHCAHPPRRWAGTRPGDEKVYA